jgi:hypothetical protein
LHAGRQRRQLDIVARSVRHGQAIARTKVQLRVLRNVPSHFGSLIDKRAQLRPHWASAVDAIDAGQLDAERHIAFDFQPGGSNVRLIGRPSLDPLIAEHDVS